MSEKHTCPVCGFNGLKEPSYGKSDEPSYEICPCCGFEFGFDGDNNNQAVFTEFRQRWIENGTPWFMQKLKPKNWDIHKQLGNLKRVS